MANNSIALGVEVPDFGNSFARGAAASQDRQLNSMKMEMAQREQGREEALQLMNIMGSIGLGAMGGNIEGEADPAKWEQGLDYLDSMGIGLDTQKYRGKPQLARMLVDASVSASDRLKMARDDREFALALEKFDADLAQNAESNAIRRDALDFQRTKGKPAPAGYRFNDAGDLEFIPGGPADPKSISTRRGQLTEGQSKTAGYAHRMVQAESTLSKADDSGQSIMQSSDPGKSSMNPFSGDFWEQMNRKYGPNMTQSPEYQKFFNGAMEWIRAKLRKESGAAISAQEWESEFQTYFPQPGDTPEVIQQKEVFRQNAVESMKAESRGGYKSLFEDDSTPDATDGERRLENMTDAELEALSDAELEALVNGE